MAIDSSNKAYIVWEDDRNSNKDIYIASSSSSFTSKETSQITSNASDQITPAIAVDSSNTVYVVWTDTRGSSNDIYGAASNASWADVAVVSNANNQSSPVVTAEASGTILHLLWVDDTLGDDDVYYVSSDGLPSSPLNGSNIIDDSSGSAQSAPDIIVTGSTGGNLKVYVCWKDNRNISGGNGDMDIYLVEVNSDSGTNVLVGDDSTNSAQSRPAIGIDGYNYPYLVWKDDRSTSTDIYYAGSTFVQSTYLDSENVTVTSGATVGTEPAAISKLDDISVVIPAGAYQCDIKVTISKIKNPPKLSLNYFVDPYEIGPSGVDFSKPITIIMPYEVTDSDDPALAYWYDSFTGTYSQEGITNIQNIIISPTLHALRFNTVHLSQFFVGDQDSGGGNPIEDIWRFGNFAGRRNVSLTVDDSEGNPVKFTLSGGGYGEITGGSDFSQVILYDTTGRSSLKIATKGC